MSGEKLMKSSPVLVLGLGMLLGFGAFSVGCGDDSPAKKNDGSVDAKDGGSGGAKGTGGVMSTGGNMGSGGALGTGGMVGSGGSGGTVVMDGGPVVEGGADVFQSDAQLDLALDQVVNHDTNTPDDTGTVMLDTQGADTMGEDTAPVSLDTATMDMAEDMTAPAIDTAAMETEMDSGEIDGSVDTQ